MTIMTGRLRFFLLLLIAAAASGARAQQVRAYVEPAIVKPNQITTFIIAVQDGQINSFNNQLRLPLQIQQTSVASTSQQFSIVNGRQSSSIRLSWGVMPVEPGEFVIPSQDLVVNGQTVSTNEVKLIVEQGGPPPGAGGAHDELEPILQIEPGRKEIYQGEVMQLNCSLYMPRQTQLRRLGLVEIEKSDFAIARFPQQSDQTMTSINGVGYYVLTFRSTLSSLRTGDLKIGPASMEVLVEVPVERGARQNIFPPGFPQPFFNVQTEPRKLTVKSQTVTLKVLPLPEEGRPANFSGAVGDFTLSATATPTTLTVGDPVAVDLVISGSGNFDALTEPQMQSNGGWKPYPAKRYSIEGNLDQNQTPTLERKIGFSQVFIPEAVHDEVPPFEISFFNSEKRQYITLRTEPIPLAMTPAPVTAATESAQGASAIAPLPIPAADPQPDITDIVIQPRPQARWLAPTAVLWLQSRAFWTAQAAPVGMLAFAVVLAWVRRRKEALQAGRAGEIRKAWRSLESARQLPDSGFLHQAAQFIQVAHGLHDVRDPELKKILDRWQNGNFAATPAPPLTSSERAGMFESLVRLLRASLAKTAVLLFLILSMRAAAAVEAAGEESPDSVYQAAIAELEQGNFSKAQYLAESLTKKDPPVLGADLFELIGHARYRQEDPGRAALWYQRARLIDARSPELRQNLRHLHEQHRFLTFGESSTLSEWSLWLTLNEWLVLASVGLWLVMLPLAWRVLSGRRTQTWPVTVSVLGLILLVPAGAFAALRPQSALRVADISIITPRDVRAYTAATTTAGTVMDLPPGSQVRVLEKRGAWTYVEIPSRPENLRGWVENRVLIPYWPWDSSLIP
ncbi:MAG TPA: hypothetical protein DIT64_12440 [Verrucomicrobiales bacterium]|nr:hypothetical protein [Verrucomicrobiales bacterium]